MSLVVRPAEDGDEIGGAPHMYHWGFMFDGGLEYYAVHVYNDGQVYSADHGAGQLDGVSSSSGYD